MDKIINSMNGFMDWAVKGIRRGLLLFLLGVVCVCWGDTIPTSGVDTCLLGLGESRMVYNKLDVDSNYFTGCNGGLVVRGVAESRIRVRGDVNTENYYDYLDVYDGEGTDGVYLGRFTGGDVVVDEMLCESGSVYLWFHSDGSVVRRGVELEVTCCLFDTTRMVYGMVDSAMAETDGWVMWMDSSDATQWMVSYGMDGGWDTTVVVSEKRVHLENLRGGKLHYCDVRDVRDSLSCGGRRYEFHTPCISGNLCTDFSDLNSCIVTGTYGNFADPNLKEGIVDLGSGNMNSRHTVHRAQNEFDPMTNNLLRTVPTDELASVRLGNWNSGAEAESITYLYRVDTSVYNMLVMKYAAVLEDPNHPLEDQPRFKFALLDEDMVPIDAGCYSADYIANSELGWNVYGEILWKDWTTVGVDLDPLHGQTIYIQLTSYDCNYGAHFGYAYFTLRCGNKVIKASNCGNTVANTFTAPDGYTYEWYREDDADSILGTNQSLDVTVAGTYKCRMTMVGATSDSCGLVMTAVAGYRYPYARFSWEEGEEPCEYTVKFREQSMVTGDEAHTILSDEGCEAVEWDFGDGETSTDRNPVHGYDTLGDYVVRMVASLSNGQCTDTIVDTVRVGYMCPRDEYRWDTICAGDEYSFYDTVLTTTGEYVKMDGVVSVHMNLFVWDSIKGVVMDTIVENDLPWSYGGEVYEDEVTGDSLVFESRVGCDSLVVYSLKVWRNVVEDMDSVICENSLPLVWNGVTFADEGRDTVVLDSAGLHGVDSTVRMELVVKRNSYAERNDTIVQNSLPHTYLDFVFDTAVEDSVLVIENGVGCDSVIDYSLVVHRNVSVFIEREICADALPYEWNGLVFDSTEIKKVKLYDQYGADSVVSMSVTVHPVYEVDTAVDLCVDEVYEMNGNVYRESGVYWDTLATVKGCDSVVVLDLTMRFNRYTIDSLILCKDGVVTWQDGETYDAPTTEPMVRYETYDGCDSVVRLNLGVHYLEARSLVTPTWVTAEHSEVRLEDRSVGNLGRVWYLPDMTSTAGVMNYDYPMMWDSVVVKMVVNDLYGCMDSTETVIRKDRGQIWAPNVFTPGEVENNVFRIAHEDLLSIEVVIYDRNGGFIYRYDTLDGGWNGMKDGTMCKQAAYVYHVRYRTKAYPDRYMEATGTVLLLR